jgi:hypothetical protein
MLREGWACISGTGVGTSVNGKIGYDCPAGYWCPLNNPPIPCPSGSYSPTYGAISNGCILCSGMLTTLQPGAPNASACVFEKKFAPLNSGFEKMRFCGDWLFWIKLLENTSISYTSDSLSHFRHHGSSTRNQKTPKEELKKKLEIILIIESTRKKFRMGLPNEHEFAMYDWVINGFYRQLIIPKRLKDRIIFYSNRYFPNMYSRYRKVTFR